jgi:hypothetical protein
VISGVNTTGPAVVSPALSSDPVIAAGTQRIRKPKGGLGNLMPTGLSYSVSSELKNVIKDAETAFDLSVINSSFNPLKPMLGEFTDARSFSRERRSSQPETFSGGR